MASKRTFEDVVSAVSGMTGRRPNRTTDNIGVTKRLVDRLGLTPVANSLKVVHVAGTKGKGSTCAFASKLLSDAYGKRVGLFTSPHLFDVRERIQVNNAMLPKDKFTEYFFEMKDSLDAIASNSESDFDRESASRSNFFRFMFLLSLHTFQRENVEVAIYEVGIGGRQDSTNIFEKPVACGITALGMDHMELLGDTVEKIAYEKAGIIKADVPCFSCPQRFHPSTRNVLKEEGRKVGGPVIFLDDEVINVRRWPKLQMGGDHFVENSRLGFALARTAVGIPVPMPLVHREWDAIEATHIEGRSEVIRVIDLIERDPRRQRSASVLLRAIEQRNAAEMMSQQQGASQKASTSSSSNKLIDMKDLAFYLDGAHNPESMMVMSEWFFSVIPRGLGAPAEMVTSNGGKGGSDSLPPTPPPTPRTAAGAVTKVLPSHLVLSASATDPKELTTTRVRNTILFYCTRSPKDMLRFFMPYHHLIDKIIFCLIPSPKPTEGHTQREAAEEDRLALQGWTEAWRNLYREVPCYAVAEAFQNMEECLEVIKTTPFRVRPEEGVPQLYPAPANANTASAPAANPVDLNEVHTEDRVLVTGSVLFVGDTLKMMHDVGLYPDN